MIKDKKQKLLFKKKKIRRLQRENREIERNNKRDKRYKEQTKQEEKTKWEERKKWIEYKKKRALQIKKRDEIIRINNEGTIYIEGRGEHSFIMLDMIINYHEIININIRNPRIFVNIKDANENDFLKKYISEKYPKKNIFFEIPNKYDYYLNPNFTNGQNITFRDFKNKDRKTHFYISHRLPRNNWDKLYPNIHYLTPFTYYNFYRPSIFPFSDVNINTNIPIYTSIGGMGRNRRNFNLLFNILKQKYKYDFRIKIIGKCELPDILDEVKEKIIVKTNLNSYDFHKELCDSYCFLQLTIKKTQPRYYSYSATCAPIYAYGFKKKILIDKDLQDIYNLDNVQIFNDENDICDAFEKTLNSFYNK